ncbi:hypothetical protein [Nostoc sp. LEGE 12450]|uniref:hypothetical protein n=1 Tax=Nostoc sp. LEGE 12450 TaxID=1828643 RepID=UPI001880D972|nr:hypothetical protein [Nostoc sp. LEGE 12450]MBE8988763.1 hypothetical protein [Nostoc sp. LEGE 12450]
MPKRKSNQTNSSPSPEIVTPQKPAIVRVVKQETTDTPAPSESSSTTAPKENQNSVPELHVLNNQSQSIEMEPSNSSPQATPDAGLEKINAAIDSSDFPLTASTPTVNLEELAQNSSSKAIDLAQPELENKQPKLEKRIPPYKKLETVTNSQGQTFALGEEIQVSTCNFGSQSAVITFFYSAPDGSIWSSYYPLTKDQWRRGCCRIEYLKKLDENFCNG